MRILNDNRALMLQMDVPEAIRPVVIIDHASEFGVVLADLLIPADYGIALHDLQGFHVEVVLEREVDINFAGTHQ